MDKFESRRKAKWKSVQDARAARRQKVIALAKQYPQVEVARRMGISRQRVCAIVGAGK